MQAEKLNRFVNNPGLLNAETLDELKGLVENYPFFEVGWLLYLKNLKQVKSLEYNLLLKQVAVRVSDRKMLYKFLNTNFQKKHLKLDIADAIGYKLEEENETPKSGSLIDKFLSSEPRAIRQSLEGEHSLSGAPVKDLLEKSTFENDEFITETLATIYFQQKNYEKALDAYTKLSLKYPEKSVYFATRIEEIEKLKNI